MASASQSGTSINVSWSSFGTSGNVAKNYNVELFIGSSQVDQRYALSSSARNHTFLNVRYNTSYTIKVYAQMQVGANKVEYAYVTTGSPPTPPPSTPTGLRLLSSNNGSLSLGWNWQPDATHWCLEIFHSASGQMVWWNYNIGQTSMHVSPLNNGVSYYAKLYAQNQAGGGQATFLYGLVPTAPKPTQPTGLTLTALDASGQVRAYWNASSNATRYYITVRVGSEYGQQVWSDYSYSTSITITNLGEYKLYYVTVSALNDSGDSSNYTIGSVTTKDVTPPTITVSGDGNGKMYVSFTAYDSGSGMRPQSTYYAEVSNPNGSSYGQGQYQTGNYRTFIKDAYGNEFVHNAYYYMRVIAFDAMNNSNNNSVRVQYKVARPVSWTWHTPKTAGQPISLTASEWNSFCLRINQFRQYKGYDNINFTSATSGGRITAYIINEGIFAIRPLASVPSQVAVGDKITAQLFNSLASSLNSIT